MVLCVALQCYYNKRGKLFSLFVVSRWLMAAWQMCHKSEIRHLWRHHLGLRGELVSTYIIVKYCMTSSQDKSGFQYWLLVFD